MHTHFNFGRLFARALAVLVLAGSQLAAAQVLVFDRGLPTANLNQAAGANRSNYQWADIETAPITPYLPGDDFTLPAGGPFNITTIRVWSTNSVGLSLRGGIAGGPITVLSSVYTATPVTYANLQTYERFAGGFLPLFQIDFTVNIPLPGGTTFQFFLDGPPTPSPLPPDFVGALLHASTAALSGSPQQGSNDILLFLNNANGVETWNAATGAGTYAPGFIGATQPSDSNVQVFALAAGAGGTTGVPTMSEWALVLMALLLAGAAFFTLRRR